MNQNARQTLENMVVKRYFANVDNRRLDSILQCFAPDAVFTIQSSFTTYNGRDIQIRDMFVRLFDNYPKKIWHGDFRHIVDTEREHIASQFNVELIDGQNKTTRLSNCNFFWLENGQFKRVYVYMSGENVLR